MKRSHNRSVIAARALANGLAGNRPIGKPGTDLRARPSTVTTPSGHVKRTKAMKMTGAQRNSIGKRSEWSASPQFFTDPRWSQTVGNRDTGTVWPRR